MNLRRFGVWTNLAIGALLMLLVWAMLVWVASRPALRVLIDLTPQRVNSVDPVTEELLRDLRAGEAEVEFHLFRQQLTGQPQSPEHGQALAIRGRLLQLTTMLLRRYAAIGGESVRVIEHSPYDDTAAYREAAEAFAYTSVDNEALVVAVRQKGQERRFRKLSLVSDLAVIDLPNSAGPGGGSTVPILKDYQGEMAISSSLKSLLVQGTPIVYVLKGYSSTVQWGNANQLDYGNLIDGLMNSGFEVRELKLRAAGGVPADATLVMCIHPNRDFLPRDAAYLYEYLRRGGRLFINYGWSPTPDMNPDGGKLGELLGYRVTPQPVFHKVPNARGGPSMDGTESVARLGLYANRLHPTTKVIAESGRPLDFVYARELLERPERPSNVRIEPLLTTGPEAWRAVQEQGGRGHYSYRAPTVGLGQRIVGLAIDVDPAEVDSAQTQGGTSKAGARQASVGHAVMITGAFCHNMAFRMFGDLALNVCNWMAERRVLLDIAGARYEQRNLDIKEPEVRSIWWLLVVYVPGAFFVLGLIMWWRRRH